MKGFMYSCKNIVTMWFFGLENEIATNNIAFGPDTGYHARNLHLVLHKFSFLAKHLNKKN